MVKIYYGKKIIELHFSNYKDENYLQDFKLQNEICDKIFTFIHEKDSSPILKLEVPENSTIDELFQPNFIKISAAGGLVINPENEYLFIFRRGKWDLPKGKADENETPETTALREVEEECGINQLAIQKLLHTSWHIYYEKKNYIFKQTFWYLMTVPNIPQLTPQTEEGIEKAIWVKMEEVSELLKNTFPSIIDVWEKYNVLIK